MPKTKLPAKLSQLMRVALDDLAKVEALPKKYQVNMDQWHTPIGEGSSKCHVCFAGAVMSQTLKTSPKKKVYSDSFNRRAERKFDALNLIRLGDIGGAMVCMNLPRHKRDEICNKLGWVDLHVVHYEDNKRLFRQDMETIVGFLESEDL